jgi:hypothetical protein
MVTSAKAPSSIVDTTGWLTILQAIDLLGVSRNTIGRWEREGRLHPEKAQRGDSARWLIVYDPNELAKMPRRFKQLPANEAGELAARVFEFLDEGKSVREIVIQTRETPTRIEDLRQQWLDGGGADLVIGKEAREEYQRITGKPFRGVSDLVQTIADLVPHGETPK